MNYTGVFSLVLIVINIWFTYKGLKSHSFFEDNKFQVDKLLVNKEYKRIFSSSFLHLDWSHLFFNMISLWFFSSSIEAALGPIPFLLVYFISIAGGDILSLVVHRNHGDYSSVGASGAVCGIIFATVALFPGMDIRLFGVIPFPGWLYGLLYVGYSVYGIRSKRDNVGHEAHLGGALAGMLAALVFVPSAISENLVTILLIFIPGVVFIYLIITKPSVLMVDNLFFKNHEDFYSIDHRYNAEKQMRQKELDRILEKIYKTGMESLTKKEKEKLKEYSKDAG